MTSNLFPVKKKHDFYNSIYSTFNSNYDSKTRIYTKHCENFDFKFSDNKLQYVHDNRADVLEACKIFTNLKESDYNPNVRSVQNRISYYLSNRLVPVLFLILGF